MLSRCTVHILFSVFLLAAPSYAAETVEAGKSCDQLGASTMLTDQTGIAVCARETAGSSKLIWKSMSGGSAQGTYCGMTAVSASSSFPYNPSVTEFPCNGKGVVTVVLENSGSFLGQKKVKSVTNNCPSGYKLTSLSIPSVSQSCTTDKWGGQRDCTIGVGASTSIYMCLKE